nr:PREDICTED: uncharacterized protein LOC107079439 [Lepisosteus oculatus]
MRAVRGLLPALLFLQAALTDDSRGERCHGLRHLENGRTFFRYGGLYVTFTCNPGFRVHGFRTSSCISGRWTRAPPACVASGCPNPGGILHGSSMMTPDRSFVFFMCDKGYRLFGCPLLYCRGRTWNSTKPVCKESDVMSSDKQKLLALLRSSLAQNLNAPSALKNLFQLQYDSSLSAASKDIFLDPGLLAEEPRASNPKQLYSAGALRQLTVSNRVPEPKEKEVFIEKQYQSGRATTGGGEESEEVYSKPSNYERPLYKPLSSLTSPASSLSIAKLSMAPSPPAPDEESSPSYSQDKMLLMSPTSMPAEHDEKTYDQTTSHLVFFTEPFTIASQTVEEQQAQHSIYSKTHEATVTSESVTNSLSSASTRRPQLPASPKARIIDSTASQELNRPSFELSSTTSDQIPLLDSSVSATLYHVTNTPDTSEDSLRTPSFPQAQSSVLDSFNTSLVFKGNIAKSGSINKDHAKFSESLASPQNSTASTFLVGESYSRYSGSAPHQIRSEMSPDASFSDMNQKTPLKHPEKNNQGHLERTIIFSSDEIKTNVTFQDNTEHSTRAGKKNNKPTTASSATGVLQNVSLISTDNLKPVINSLGQSAASSVGKSQEKHAHQWNISTTEEQRNLQPLKDRLAKTAFVDLATTQPKAGMWVTEHADMDTGHHNQQPPATQGTTATAGTAAVSTEQTAVNDSAEQATTTQQAVGLNRSDSESLMSSPGTMRIQTQERLDQTGDATVHRINALPAAGLPDPTPSGSHHNFVEITADELPLLGSLKRRPVCPYPPLPPHGTFYFRTAVNPSPWQYRHYVQYSCYPGYTLANGDVYSYCLHNGRWSGVTPACLEVTPCSVNNGGCSQLCEVTPEGRAQCNCRDGFELLQDNRTCRDVNECAEELHYCQQDCINTFGFYKCSCWPGYLLSEDERSCSDVDECQLPIGFASCLFGCINTPGSFRCHCPEGYRMAAVEGHCIGLV